MLSSSRLVKKRKRIFYPLNQNIQVEKLLVIDQNEQNHGVMPRGEALKIAQEAELDLVVVAKNAKPPVAKILDFRKFLYEKKQEGKRGKSKKTGTKELRLGPNISEHDLNTRIERARKFLKERHKVKFTVPFLGRMITHKEVGHEKLRKIFSALSEVGEIDRKPWFEGKRLMTIVKPK